MQVVRLTANYEIPYTRTITELAGANARKVILPRIDKIVAQPGATRGGKRRPIQVHGDLYRMLEFASAAVILEREKPPRGYRGGFL